MKRSAALVVALAAPAAWACDGRGARAGDPGADVARGVVAVHSVALGSLCTGTVVARGVVLTARHCVARTRGDGCEARFEPPEPASTLRVTFGAQAPAADARPASHVHVPTSGDRLCGDDLAVIVVEAPADVRPRAVAGGARPTHGTRYRALGFGALDESGHGVGALRRWEGRASSPEPGLLGAVALRDEEWLGDAPAYEGSSGGPALDAAGAVVGVLSRGVTRGAELLPVYVAPAAHAAWLRAVVGARAAELGDPAPPWLTAR